jgi:histidyl-tRNA synthetase
MIIVGPKDLENNKVTIRNMLTGKEDKIEINKIKNIKW